jgi:hypothetical protein
MIETRLLAVFVSTCLLSTSTSTTSSESRPINFNSRIGHKRTKFVWQESLFNKILNRKCVAIVLPCQQLEQNKCSELIPVMRKAVQK